MAMSVLALRSVERVLQALPARRLLVAERPKGANRFAVTLQALRFCFPALRPEAGSH